MLELTPGFTAIPNHFLDQIATTLTTAQLRVALYIYRHTIGYQKISDAISYNQFTDGITTSDGRKLDTGAGVSRRSLPAALAGLERRRLISRSGGGIGNGAVRYTIVFRPAQASPAPVVVSKPKEPAPASQNLTEPQSAPAPKLEQTLPTSQPLPQEQLEEQPGQKQTAPTPQVGQNVSAFEPAPGQILPPTKQTDSKIKPDRAEAVTFITQEIAGISTAQAEKLVITAMSNQRDISYIKRLVGYVASVAGNPAAMLTTLIKTNQDRTTGPGENASHYSNRRKSELPGYDWTLKKPTQRQPIDFSKPFYQRLIAQQNNLSVSASQSEAIE